MAGKLILLLICVTLTVIRTNAAGELTILHSPDSLLFHGSNKAYESMLKEIFSVALGFSLEQDTNWNGLYIINPFKTPEAVAVVSVDGVASLGESGSKVIPLVADEYESDIYDTIKRRIEQRLPNGGSKIVNIDLSNSKELNSYSDIFGKIGNIKPAKQTLQHLKISEEVDHRFLTELEALKAITAKIESGAVSSDNVIDFFNLRFRSLHPLSDFYGANSLHTKEAKTLLSKALEDFTDAIVKAYDGLVLVTSLATDVPHIRRVPRAASEAPAVNRQSKEEGAYSPDYPAIFNIILWFSVVFAFSLIAIVYAIMDMDPGRDSIIYRMTSTRMKKDN